MERLTIRGTVQHRLLHRVDYTPAGLLAANTMADGLSGLGFEVHRERLEVRSGSGHRGAGAQQLLRVQLPRLLRMRAARGPTGRQGD